MSGALRGRFVNYRRRAALAVANPFGGPPRKEHAACCLAKRLPDGRPVIGLCGPDCIRRRTLRSSEESADERGEMAEGRHTRGQRPVTTAARHDVPCPACGEGRCSGPPNHLCVACGAQICSREWP